MGFGCCFDWILRRDLVKVFMLYLEPDFLSIYYKILDVIVFKRRKFNFLAFWTLLYLLIIVKWYKWNMVWYLMRDQTFKRLLFPVMERSLLELKFYSLQLQANLVKLSFDSHQTDLKLTDFFVLSLVLFDEFDVLCFNCIDFFSQIFNVFTFHLLLLRFLELKIKRMQFILNLKGHPNDKWIVINNL